MSQHQLLMNPFSCRVIKKLSANSAKVYYFVTIMGTNLIGKRIIFSRSGNSCFGNVTRVFSNGYFQIKLIYVSVFYAILPTRQGQFLFDNLIAAPTYTRKLGEILPSNWNQLNLKFKRRAFNTIFPKKKVILFEKLYNGLSNFLKEFIFRNPN